MQELILVVDDEPKIVKLTRDYLAKDGYRVISATDGLDALAMARREKPDLVVLDLMLPGMDGWSLPYPAQGERHPHYYAHSPLEESDQIVGLELGADDYITKPFSPRTLVARIRAVLRRAQGLLKPAAVIHAGELEIDLDGLQVLLKGEPVHLTPNEFRLLSVWPNTRGSCLPVNSWLIRCTGFHWRVLTAVSIRISRTCAANWKQTRPTRSIIKTITARVIALWM